MESDLGQDLDEVDDGDIAFTQEGPRAAESPNFEAGGLADSTSPTRNAKNEFVHGDDRAPAAQAISESQERPMDVPVPRRNPKPALALLGIVVSVAVWALIRTGSDQGQSDAERDLAGSPSTSVVVDSGSPSTSVVVDPDSPNYPKLQNYQISKDALYPGEILVITWTLLDPIDIADGSGEVSLIIDEVQQGFGYGNYLADGSNVGGSHTAEVRIPDDARPGYAEARLAIWNYDRTYILLGNAFQFEILETSSDDYNDDNSKRSGWPKY